MATRKTQGPDEINVDPDTGEVIEPGQGLAVPDDPQQPAEREGDVGLAQYLVTESSGGDPSPEQSYRMIIDQILSADTPDDVLVPIDAVSANDFIGEPFQLHSFTINRSDFEVGSPFYASMKVTLLRDDSKMIINTGNQALLAQLVRLSQLDAFPQTCMISQGKRPNRFGTLPIRLRIAEAPAKPAESAPPF